MILNNNKYNKNQVQFNLSNSTIVNKNLLRKLMFPLPRSPLTCLFFCFCLKEKILMGWKFIEECIFVEKHLITIKKYMQFVFLMKRLFSFYFLFPFKMVLVNLRSLEYKLFVPYQHWSLENFGTKESQFCIEVEVFERREHEQFFSERLYKINKCKSQLLNGSQIVNSAIGRQ